MKHSILIIDDEEIGASNLSKSLQKQFKDYYIDIAFKEEDINYKIQNSYFNIAIVDLRMDSFSKGVNGFTFINQIILLNPFAKIIIVSAFLSEYYDSLNKIMSTGRIEAIIDKENYEIFVNNIKDSVLSIIQNFESNPNANSIALEAIYSDAKNEKDSYYKGVKFENFTTILFSQIGFNHITKRVKDKSLNEVDLIIRNEINDVFFQKLSPYIFVECKNTIDNVDKNQFKLFRDKVRESNGLSKFGIIITSSSFTWNSYFDAIRGSESDLKIIFITNIEIEKLIRSNDKLVEFKRIIDEQVKDN